MQRHGPAAEDAADNRTVISDGMETTQEDVASRARIRHASVQSSRSHNGSGDDGIFDLVEPNFLTRYSGRGLNSHIPDEEEDNFSKFSNRNNNQNKHETKGHSNGGGADSEQIVTWITVAKILLFGYGSVVRENQQGGNHNNKNNTGETQQQREAAVTVGNLRGVLADASSRRNDQKSDRSTGGKSAGDPVVLPYGSRGQQEPESAGEVLESYYVLFSMTHRTIAPVLIVLSGIGNILDLVVRDQTVQPLFITVIRIVLTLVMFVLAGLHYFFSVKPHRPWATDGVGFYKLGDVRASDFQAAKRGELIAFLSVIVFASFLISTYISAATCSPGETETFRQAFCLKFLNTWVCVASFSCVFVMKPRAKFQLIALAYIPIPMHAFRWTAPYDSQLELGIKLFTYYATALLWQAIALSNEFSNRCRFETAAQLRKTARRQKQHQLAVAESLRKLVPSIDKLSKNQPVIDVNQEVMLSLFRVDDFAHWSTTLMPMAVISVVETLFSWFDAAGENLGIDKLTSVGDSYLASTNLRTRLWDLAQGAPCLISSVEPKTILEFALLQHLQLKELRARAGPMLTFLKGRIAIHCGPAVGVVLGTQSLSYDVFGDALTTLTEILPLAPLEGTLVTGAAQAFVNDPSAELGSSGYSYSRSGYSYSRASTAPQGSLSGTVPARGGMKPHLALDRGNIDDLLSSPLSSPGELPLQPGPRRLSGTGRTALVDTSRLGMSGGAEPEGGVEGSTPALVDQPPLTPSPPQKAAKARGTRFYFDPLPDPPAKSLPDPRIPALSLTQLRTVIPRGKQPDAVKAIASGSSGSPLQKQALIPDDHSLSPGHIEPGEKTTSDQLRFHYLQERVAIREAQRLENAARIKEEKRQRRIIRKSKLAALAAKHKKERRGNDYYATTTTTGTRSTDADDRGERKMPRRISLEEEMGEEFHSVVAPNAAPTAQKADLRIVIDTVEEETEDDVDDEEEDDEENKVRSPQLGAAQQKTILWTEDDFKRDISGGCANFLGVQPYLNPDVQNTYGRFCLDSNADSVLVGQLLMIGYAFITMFVTWAEDTVPNTRDSTHSQHRELNTQGIMIFTLVICFGRLFLRRCFLANAGPRLSSFFDHDGLISVITYAMVVFGTFAGKHPSLLTGRSLFFIVAVSAAVREEMSRYPPMVLFGCISACVVGVGGSCLAWLYASAALQYMTGMVLFIVVSMYVLSAIVSDQQRKSHFEAVMLAQVLQDRAQFAVESHHVLLEMLIPPPLIPAIKKKAFDSHAEGAPELVQWLGDICVATMRLAPLRLQGGADRQRTRIDSVTTESGGGGSHPSSPRGSTTFKKLEATMVALERAIAVMGDGLLYKVSTIGDMVTVAGPIVDKRMKSSLGRSLAASHAPNVALLNLDSGEDKVLEAAVAMSEMVRMLIKSFGRGITAAVTCDSAFAGVMGSTRPSLDLLGNATRSTRTIVEAAPQGFVGFLTGFVRLLEAGGKCPPRYPGDLELGPTQPWALRSQGLCRVRPVRLAPSDLSSPLIGGFSNSSLIFTPQGDVSASPSGIHHLCPSQGRSSQGTPLGDFESMSQHKSPGVTNTNLGSGSADEYTEEGADSSCPTAFAFSSM